MQSPPLSEKAGFTAVLELSLAEALPMELVLGILDVALINGRVNDLRRCLSLSLVCHTVRAAVLPVVYETLFLDIKSKAQGKFMGWDGHPHTDAKLAFLSWLLHDPTAPPRRYIKHVIFRDRGDFSYKSLGWIVMGVDCEPSEWPFERLTARYHQDVTHLYRAGLRPRKAFGVEPSRGYGGLLSLVNIFAGRIQEADAYGLMKTHDLTWIGEPRPDETSVDDRNRIIHRAHALCCEVEPSTAAFIRRPSGQQVLSVHTIQLTNGDYLHRYPSLLLNGLAAVLECSSNAQVILACSIDYRIAGQTIGDFIRAAAPDTLPTEALEGRIRISHSAWIPIGAQVDQFYNLAHAIRCGGDPWDMGRSV